MINSKLIISLHCPLVNIRINICISYDFITLYYYYNRVTIYKYFLRLICIYFITDTSVTWIIYLKPQFNVCPATAMRIFKNVFTSKAKYF